ncbi:MAG: OsmC family protein [Dehalococcoidia bacterium]|nr:OsmC family protein [Dehalococcoidia bacterium]
MSEDKNLKTIQERNARTLRLRPSVGQGTATTTVRVRSGVTCDIEDGAWKLVADETPGDGGAGLGPDPGVLVRAGLGSCLAMGYVLWAARLEIPLDSVEVVVEADYDARGMYGVDDSVPPGWTAVRYTAHISSPAGEERVRQLVATADAHSPVLDDLRRAVPVRGELKISEPVRAAAPSAPAGATGATGE